MTIMDGVSRSRFATSDHEVAEHFLRSAYVDQRLRLGSPAGDFRYEHEAAATHAFAINRVRHSARMTVDIEPLDDLLVVDVLHGGRVVFERSCYDDASATAGEVLLVPPAGRSRTIMDDVDVDTLVLSQDDVAGYAAAIWGVDADRVRITGLTPVSAGAAEHCAATVRHVQRSVLESPAAGSNRIVLDSAARLLSAAVLSTFPNTAQDTVADPHTPPPSDDVPAARLRAVVDYLRAHAGEPVGPAEVAAVVGVPVRALDAALRSRHGTTAARELWRARLRGAHRDLREADPATASVSGVATRWGFLGRSTFRVAYARYTGGETPEQTLRH